VLSIALPSAYCFTFCLQLTIGKDTELIGFGKALSPIVINCDTSAGSDHRPPVDGLRRFPAALIGPRAAASSGERRLPVQRPFQASTPLRADSCA
jgi:hypothetical protein